MFVFIDAHDEHVLHIQVAQAAIDGFEDFFVFGLVRFFLRSALAGVDDEYFVAEQLVGKNLAVIVGNFGSPVFVEDGVEVVDLDFAIGKSFVFFDEGAESRVVWRSFAESCDDLYWFFTFLKRRGIEKFDGSFRESKGAALGEVFSTMMCDAEVKDEADTKHGENDLQDRAQSETETPDGLRRRGHFEIGILFRHGSGLPAPVVQQVVGEENEKSARGEVVDERSGIDEATRE